jgi:hypothetical protein
VNYATRVQNFSSTSIDNIFIDSGRLSSSCVSPMVSSLSDHDAQFLTANNIILEENLTPLKQKTREINNETIAHFQHPLGNVTWEHVFKNKDTNYRCNSFLCIFLSIFEASFPMQNKNVGRINNHRITQSCGHKQFWYVDSRSGNNPYFRAYYIKYCKILSRIIRKAKRYH